MLTLRCLTFQTNVAQSGRWNDPQMRTMNKTMKRWKSTERGLKNRWYMFHPLCNRGRRCVYVLCFPNKHSKCKFIGRLPTGLIRRTSVSSVAGESNVYYKFKLQHVFFPATSVSTTILDEDISILDTECVCLLEVDFQGDDE